MTFVKLMGHNSSGKSYTTQHQKATDWLESVLNAKLGKTATKSRQTKLSLSLFQLASHATAVASVCFGRFDPCRIQN